MTGAIYIRLARGFAYLVAISDGSSRKTLGWRLSHTLETEFCVDCLEEALRTHGKPEIFNSDQGARFTRQAFTNILNRAVIAISKEGWGRVFDNLFAERLWRSVKDEHVSLKDFATMDELRLGLTEYFAFHNGERPHRSLGQQTPEGVYRAALNGGATIVDGFAGAGEKPGSTGLRLVTVRAVLPVATLRLRQNTFAKRETCDTDATSSLRVRESH